MGLLTTIFDIGQAAMSNIAHRQLVTVDREEGSRRLLSIVNGMNEAQFDAFELEYLQNLSMYVDPQKRVRAAELYGLMKVAEYMKFGTFRGFSTPGHALE